LSTGSEIYFRSSLPGTSADQKSISMSTTTIIIPLRNPGGALLPTLQGLIATTPEDAYNVVFIDCATTDGSREFVEQLEGDVRVVDAPANAGLAKWVNLVLNNSSNQSLRFIVVPVGFGLYPNWFQDTQTELDSSVLATMSRNNELLVGLRADFLRTYRGLDENVPENDVLGEYERRLTGTDDETLKAQALGIDPNLLGEGMGDSLARVLAAARDHVKLGGLPDSAAERLRERLWQEEERQQLLLARGGRDVCWTDEGIAEPKVTIRIATYNRADELMEIALPSAQNQTYTNLDILVVGDHTDDATVNAMASVRDPRVRFFNLPAQALYPKDRHGHWLVHGSPAMNLGIELAEGSWIAPMDDDDAMTPDHVEVLLREARARRSEFVWSKTLMEMPDGWQVLGSAPLGPGATTSGAVMWSSGLRFMKMSTTCWKFGEPHDQNMWRRMHEIGVKMDFVDHITYRYSPCVKDTRAKELVK
jgi:glycosyltransferase involved in cell wall biosynthesis